MCQQWALWRENEVLTVGKLSIMLNFPTVDTSFSLHNAHCWHPVCDLDLSTRLTPFRNRWNPSKMWTKPYNFLKDFDDFEGFLELRSKPMKFSPTTKSSVFQLLKFGHSRSVNSERYESRMRYQQLKNKRCVYFFNRLLLTHHSAFIMITVDISFVATVIEMNEHFWQPTHSATTDAKIWITSEVMNLSADGHWNDNPGDLRVLLWDIVSILGGKRRRRLTF